MITMLHEQVGHGFKGVAPELCTACDHSPACRLQTGKAMPVFFCEEFACASASPQVERAGAYSLPGDYENEFPVRKPENARFSYKGLCSSCLGLSTCMYLKPGGGTWDCATYKEIRA